MAAKTEGMKAFASKNDRTRWDPPVVQTIPINCALGAAPGTKCDRYGSLSTGTGCPN